MTMVAELKIEGGGCRNSNNVIGAFVGGECRGIAQLGYLSAINRYVAFPMVYSNDVAGETISFQAFVPEAMAVYNVSEDMTCQAGAAVGTLRQPLMLNTAGHWLISRCPPAQIKSNGTAPMPPANAYPRACISIASRPGSTAKPRK